MKLPEAEILEALLRMRSSEPKVVEWLQSRLAHNEKLAANLDDHTALRQAQGRAKEVGDILDLIQQAAAHLETRRKAAKAGTG